MLIQIQTAKLKNKVQKLRKKMKRTKIFRFFDEKKKKIQKKGKIMEILDVLKCCCSHYFTIFSALWKIKQTGDTSLKLINLTVQ